MSNNHQTWHSHDPKKKPWGLWGSPGRAQESRSVFGLPLTLKNRNRFEAFVINEKNLTNLREDDLRSSPQAARLKLEASQTILF